MKDLEKYEIYFKHRKALMKFIKKIFNLNTGYFIEKLTYDYENKYYIGYMICKGYVIFGIPGYDVIKDGYCCDFSALTKRLEKYNIKL